MNVENIKNQIEKKVVVFDIGGFKPTNELNSSYFGDVKLCSENESWCFDKNDNPMIPIFQLNLESIEYIPDSLIGIKMITLFIDSKQLPNSNDINGTSWNIREYNNLDTLIPITKPKNHYTIKPFEMRVSKELSNDYPVWDSNDISNSIRAKITDLKDYGEIDSYFDHFKCEKGFKVGGYPKYIQSGPNINPEYEFVIQIDSSEKANWYWGDSGTAYLYRNKNNKNWMFYWDCF